MFFARIDLRARTQVRVVADMRSMKSAKDFRVSLLGI